MVVTHLEGAFRAERKAQSQAQSQSPIERTILDRKSLEDEPDYRMQVVKEAHRVIMERRDERKEEILRTTLLQSRDSVLEQSRKNLRKPLIYPRLASNDCSPCRLVAAIYGRGGPATAATTATTTNSNSSRRRSLDHGKDESEPSFSNHTSAQALEASSSSSSSPSAPKAEAAVSVRIRFGANAKKNKSTNRSAIASFSQAIWLEGTHDPLPKSNTNIFLKTHYATEDEENLTYIPYFGDNDREDVVSELYNLESRRKQMEFGPECQERDTNDVIDDTLRLLVQQLNATTNNMPNNNTKLQNEIHDDLADVMDVRSERIHERHTKIALHSTSHATGNADVPTAPESRSIEEMSSPTKNSSTSTKVSYLDVMDSYRSIFCRRCFSYDCNMHGNIDKPCLELQGELAVQNERDGHWRKMSANTTIEVTAREEGNGPSKANVPATVDSGRGDGTENSDNESLDACSTRQKRPYSSILNSGRGEGTQNSDNESLDACSTRQKRPYSSILSGNSGTKPRKKMLQTALTPLQKSICDRAFLMFQGETGKVATAMDATKHLVVDHIEHEKVTLAEFRHIKPENSNRKSKKTEKTSMKNYNPTWLRRVEESEIHPLFVPCNHDGPCSEENCSCVQNAFFCTKHCVWGEKSRNFFRGCACKGGKCGTKHCACFAAKRECDPDLCRPCGACTDPPNQPATNQRCRNDNISMRRHCHLLMGKSTIEDAGWGIYCKGALKKGQFVHEYVGEVISQEEAERRGRIYDKVNRSYLFNLSSDFVVDASRKGNKTRYANHSSKPNCCTKMVNVNGDIRIGLFAKEDIEPQSELFFDYRYDVGIDNDLIIKPGKTVDWMKNPKMANKISKENASTDLPVGDVRLDVS